MAQEEKNEEIKMKPISRKWLLRILSNLLCGLPYLADSYNAKMVCFGEGAMELYACVKKLFSFFLTHGVVRRLSWPHDTLSCVLIAIVEEKKSSQITSQSELQGIN